MNILVIHVHPKYISVNFIQLKCNVYRSTVSIKNACLYCSLLFHVALILMYIIITLITLLKLHTFTFTDVCIQTKNTGLRDRVPTANASRG